MLILKALRALVDWLEGLTTFEPVSIVEAPPREALSATDRLYVLRVDFAITRDNSVQMEAALDRLRKQYGIDFLVIEPGMSLSRFDVI
jgi:hypothetical protein